MPRHFIYLFVMYTVYLSTTCTVHTELWRRYAMVKTSHCIHRNTSRWVCMCILFIIIAIVTTSTTQNHHHYQQFRWMIFHSFWRFFFNHIQLYYAYTIQAHWTLYMHCYSATFIFWFFFSSSSHACIYAYTYYRPSYPRFGGSIKFAPMYCMCYHHCTRFTARNSVIVSACNFCGCRKKKLQWNALYANEQKPAMFMCEKNHNDVDNNNNSNSNGSTSFQSWSA